VGFLRRQKTALEFNRIPSPGKRFFSLFVELRGSLRALCSISLEQAFFFLLRRRTTQNRRYLKFLQQWNSLYCRLWFFLHLLSFPFGRPLGGTFLHLLFFPRLFPAGSPPQQSLRSAAPPFLITRRTLIEPPNGFMKPLFAQTTPPEKARPFQRKNSWFPPHDPLPSPTPHIFIFFFFLPSQEFAFHRFAAVFAFRNPQSFLFRQPVTRATSLWPDFSSYSLYEIFPHETGRPPFPRPPWFPPLFWTPITPTGNRVFFFPFFFSSGGDGALQNLDPLVCFLVSLSRFQPFSKNTNAFHYRKRSTSGGDPFFRFEDFLTPSPRPLSVPFPLASFPFFSIAKKIPTKKNVFSWVQIFLTLFFCTFCREGPL